MRPSQNVTSPLDKGDHPELDTSELCSGEQISWYQSLIGSLQWIVAIGRLDVYTMVMTMSEFRIAPKIGHLKRYTSLSLLLNDILYVSMLVISRLGIDS
jgi:hypothetical protein